MISAARLFSRPRVRLRPADPPRAAPRRGRAVRALGWGAVALAVATAAFSLSVETVLPQIRDPEYGYRLLRLRELQRAHPDRPLVLVLGTSRTQNVIDPRAMGFPDAPGSPLVYNFGLSGARPPHLRLVLERLRAEGIAPAAVLVEVLPGTLAFAESGDALFRPEAARLGAGDLRRLEPHLESPWGLRWAWLGKRLSPWTAHRLVLFSHLAPNLQPWKERVDFQWEHLDDRGFSPYPHDTVPEDERERLRALALASYGPPLRDLRVSALSDQCFRDLVANCRTTGTPVAFYLAPEAPVFRSWYGPPSHVAVENFTRTLRDELGCPVFDAPLDFAEDDFADGHHALRPAAARFSRALADRHLAPWLAAGR